MSEPIHHRATLATSAAALKIGTYAAATNNFRNKGYKGFKFTLNLKSGAGNVTATVNEYDDSGNITKTWTVGPLSGTGVTIMEVYPALTPGGNVYNDILGAVYNAQIVIAGNGLALDAVLDLVA